MMPGQGDPMQAPSELCLAVAQAMDIQGPLARHDPRYRQRAEQIDMAKAVAVAIEGNSALVVEAGTGVGKTYGYLVPLLLSGRRCLVSTATKSLQDQLFLRDLPELVQRLGLAIDIALLKGRASYLCRHRLGQARQRPQAMDRTQLRLLARIETWATGTNRPHFTAPPVFFLGAPLARFKNTIK
jgi:ATP-dependent DNA helicase DinG